MMRGVYRGLDTNAALAACAVGLYALLAPLSAHTPVNDGLGPAGVSFAHMVSAFTLKGGDEVARLSPLFPALAWLPYALTGSVVASLGIVNRVALGVLVFAACLLLGERGVAARWKVFVAANLTLAIAFGRLVAFVPGRPELFALALLTLAIALSSSRRAWLVAASHVAAVMAMPVGIAAPIYGIVRSIRLAEQPTRIGLMYGPALLIWMGVQWWARGGTAGVLADAGLRALFGGQEAWLDPLFLSVAIYFLVTSAGGLSVMALVQRSAWSQLARRAPEAIALLAVLLVYVFVSRTDAPISFGFLAPVWVLAAAESGRQAGASRGWWWFVAGMAVTLVTQRPFAGVDVTAYYVEWYPYEVHRGSAAVAYAQLWEHWVPRFVVAAICVRVMALLAPGERAKEDPQPLSIDRKSPPPASLAFVPGFVAWARHLARKTIAVREGERWPRLAYAYALLLGAITAFFLFGIPIQLTDSFANLLGVQGLSVWDVFQAELGGHGYLRPLLQVQLKVVYDLAQGHYFAWYRSIQALQVMAVLLLTVRILRIRSVRDCAVVPVCLAMVLGLHTFAGAIREAFPINTFLTLLLCCLLAVCLAQSRGGAKSDVASVALLAFSLLTLETGVLVWVIVVAGYLAGYKGVSKRGLGFMTMVLAGYFVVRVAILNVGPPGLNERPSGYGFHTLEPAELVARFGEHPVPLYLYNYLCAVFTVLFAEPRGAVWRFVAALSQRTIEPWSFINVIVSTMTTAVIAWYVARRARAWRRGDILEHDRLVLLFLAVLPVNALLCVVYVKDVIMSPAGALYAIAAFVAMRELLIVMPLSRTRATRVSAASIVLLSALSVGWGWRFMGIEYNLRARATDVRSEWAFEDEWETSNHIEIGTAEAAALKRTLVDDAIWRRRPPPRLALKWPREFFDSTQ